MRTCPFSGTDQSYSIRNVVTKSWQGRFSVSLNKASEIAVLDEEVAVGRAEDEISGAIIDVQSGSGLVKRCPECSRVVVKGHCAEHGEVTGVYDLRVKGVLDNGEIVSDVLFNREDDGKIDRNHGWRQLKKWLWKRSTKTSRQMP